MYISARLPVLMALIVLLNIITGPSCWAQRTTTVVINELMASNSQTIRDPQGQYDDWVELHNPSGMAINIAGMYLTDDWDVPTQWQVPSNDPSATTIPAGGFLLVWADGHVSDEGLHASFALNVSGDELYLFDTDGATLIDRVEYGRQISDVSYGRYPDAADSWHFIGVPTPAGANTEAYEGAVADTKFSHDRGFYDGPFELTITCTTPDSTIYYTIDGSTPYSEARQGFIGRPYAGPILIDQTTCIRAVATRAGWMPSNVDTQTYIFLDEVLGQPTVPHGFPSHWNGFPADYEMDPDIVDDPRYSDLLVDSLLSLPSMSLVMDQDDLFDAGSGIYANPEREGLTWERPASIELIYPDGTKGFQTNCGIRIQGAHFRALSNSPKNSFRLLFKGIYGDTKLRYPLFGDDAVDEFDQIILRAGANDGYAWAGYEDHVQYTRDQFARDLQRATGNASAHGRFVHLYINGLYWGLYNPCERPDASFSASYYGGEKEDWDAFKHKGFTVSRGDRTALNEMLSLSREAADSTDAYQRLQGRNPDGTVNPNYPHLLDMSNYIDYMIVNMWAGNWDWPWNNYWIGRKRTDDSTGFKCYCWDAEDIMLSPRSSLYQDSVTNPDSTDIGNPHAWLRRNPEYQLLFGDHLHRLFFNGGILTVDALIDRYTELAGTVEMAIIAESARWGDMHQSRPATQEQWYDMRDTILDSYLPQRSNRVLGQFRNAGLYPNVDAPMFHINDVFQHGGHVIAGDALTMEATPGTIWYTLDGSDPRMSEASATPSGGDTVFVAEEATKRVLVPTGPVEDAWRSDPDFDDSAWISGSGGVGYERSSGYESFFDIDVLDQMYGRNTSCYIRVPFDITDPDLLEIGALTLNIRYDDGFITYLNGVEVARRNFEGQPTWNSSAFTQHSDIDAIALEPIDITPYADQLRLGRNLLTIHALNESLGSSDLLLSVVLEKGQEATGASGSVSLKAIEYSEPLMLYKSLQIRARVLQGTSWSALNEATYAVGPVAESLRISEIMYHPADLGNPDDPNTEYIELTNIGGETINLNLVTFTNGIDYIFGDVELSPDQYVLLVKDLVAFEAKYGPGLPVVGQYRGSLSNSGERIALWDAVGTVIHDFRFDDSWYDSTDGGGYSLTVQNLDANGSDALNDMNNWCPSAHVDGSPGYDDSVRPDG